MICDAPLCTFSETLGAFLERGSCVDGFVGRCGTLLGAVGAYGALRRADSLTSPVTLASLAAGNGGGTCHFHVARSHGTCLGLAHFSKKERKYEKTNAKPRASEKREAGRV